VYGRTERGSKGADGQYKKANQESDPDESEGLISTLSVHEVHAWDLDAMLEQAESGRLQATC
jgi:hypothetical protein